MASVLQREADATRYGIVLHPSIEDFLKSNGSPTKIDEASISKSITTAAMKKLVEIALKDKPTRTAIASEKVGLLKIDGYTTRSQQSLQSRSKCHSRSTRFRTMKTRNIERKLN